MKLAAQSRKVHWWFNLVIGIQLLLWSVSGFYMVVVNLDFIRGNHLVTNLHPPLGGPAARLVPTSRVLQGFDSVQSLTLKPVLDHPYYILESNGAFHLIDAVSGIRHSPIDADMAAAVARYHYSGDAPIAAVTLISENPPSELYTRPLPLWRIDFADRINSSFYIDPGSAELVTRRHDFWRIFDFFWMLHIMDYDDRTDVGNNFLRAAILLATVSVAAGVVLLFYSFAGRRRRHSSS